MHIGSNSTNVCIAAFVTTYARLKLYSELEKLQDRVLYFDTDSIIFVEHTNNTTEYKPKLGNYLGELTNEIKKDKGTHIVEFVSSGPKLYAYRTNTGYTKCVVKGFTLNYTSS